MNNFLETNEQKDVLLSLDELLHQLERIKYGNVYCWKWAIVALSCAINSALICHLSGTAQIGALEKSIATKTYEALEHSKRSDTIKLPPPRVAAPKELIKRLQKEDARLGSGLNKRVANSA